MMSSINNRINKLVIDFFGGNNSKFADLLGTSEANVRNYRIKTEPKVDILVKISDKLEINYEWLLTGEGSMLKTEQKEEGAQLKTDQKQEVSLGVQEQIPMSREVFELIMLQQQMLVSQQRTIEMMEGRRQKEDVSSVVVRKTAQG